MVGWHGGYREQGKTHHTPDLGRDVAMARLDRGAPWCVMGEPYRVPERKSAPANHAGADQA